MKTIKLLLLTIITVVSTSASAQVLKNTYRIEADTNQPLTLIDSESSDVSIDYVATKDIISCYVDGELLHVYDVISTETSFEKNIDTGELMELSIDYILRDDRGYILEMWFYIKQNKVVGLQGDSITEFTGEGLTY